VGIPDSTAVKDASNTAIQLGYRLFSEICLTQQSRDLKKKKRVTGFVNKFTGFTGSKYQLRY
jgi:hypothetical protein